MIKSNSEEKMRKVFLCMFLALVSAFTGCSGAKKNQLEQTEKSKTDGLDVSVLGIGKADCILLRNGSNAVMIDTGMDEDTKTILNYLNKYNITSLDCLIITHFDKDHVGGADGIIKNIDVKKIIQPNYEGSNKDYKQYIQAMNEKGIKSDKLTKDTKITIGDMKLVISVPKHDFEKNGDNDFSLVTSVYYGEKSFLFAGDAEKKRIKELLKDGLGQYDYLKVPHHGREAENSDDFFKTVKPKIAVITCSKEHPADEAVLKTLKKLGAEVYEADTKNVIVHSDGINLTVK
jgi:beta-lactamase superfamily II metal-dependent hydrolase